MNTIVADRRRSGISWGAVFAGVSLSLVTYLLLSLLGTAIGMAAVDPLEADTHVSGVGTAAGIWFVLTTLVSIAVGAYVAGRTAPTQGSLHGVLAWAVTTLLTLYLLASVASGILGATANIVGRGLSVAGEGVARAVPGLADKLQSGLEQSGVQLDMGNLQQELDTLLRQTGKPELAPEALRDTAAQAAQSGQAAAEDSAVRPQQAGQDLSQWWQRVQRNASPALDAADKEALVNIIAARTGRSQAEAQQIADNYEATYNKAMARYEELKKQAEQKAREAADATARAVSQAAWWSLAALLLGALIAAVFGNLGLRNRPIVYEDDVVTARPLR